MKHNEGRKSYSYQYRIMIGDAARYFRFQVMLSEDGEHFVLCLKDSDATITAETALLENQKTSVIIEGAAIYGRRLVQNRSTVNSVYIETSKEESSIGGLVL